MALITYANKSTMNANASVPATNKVQASDMNEIKTVVNGNAQQDITTGGAGVSCGYVIDNKPVYVKRINFGALPNNTTKTVNLGIDLNNYQVIKIEGYCKYSSNNIGFPIPYPNANSNNIITVNINNSNQIVVGTGTDRSSYNAWFNIYYI